MDLHLQLIVISVLLASLISFIYFSILKRSSEHNSGKVAPEPAGAWPIIGHLHLLGGTNKLLHHTLGEMADKYGPVFNLRTGSHHAVVVSSPEMAKECYTTNDRSFASRPTTTGTKHMCYDHAVFGFAPSTPHWREMRKIVIHELLSTSRFEQLKQVFGRELDRLTKTLYELSSGGTVVLNLQEMFHDMTLRAIVRSIAGKVFDRSDEARFCQKVVAQFFHLIGLFVISDAFPSLGWLDLQGTVKEMRKNGKDMDMILGGWLEEHRRRRTEGEVKGEGDQDFIDIMLWLEEEGRLSGFPIDEDTSIKSTCLSLIAGGSDTTANTVTWAISLLMNNKLELKKARQEIDNLVGTNRQVNESDIKDLVYIQAIIKETLRLHPIAPLSGPREATEDCTIGGYHVTAGTRLILNLWKIHRDPNIWGDDSSVFRPERFLMSHMDIDIRGIRNYELTPFGAGRRSCLGAGFALHTLHLTLARLLHGFEIESPMGEPVDLAEMPGLTTPKLNPLLVHLMPRLPAKLYV